MTTVEELFSAAGLPHAGVVPWGTEVSLDAPGIYVIATSENVTDAGGLADCPVDIGCVTELIRQRPEAEIDRAPANVDGLSRRIKQMWVPDEPVVYIGLASTSVRDRIRQFYVTRIGARAPHAGGWPIKMIDQDVAPLWVHFGPSADPDAAERAMVDWFAAGVPTGVREALIDPSAPLPFANLMFPGGRHKRHGLSGVKAAAGAIAGASARSGAESEVSAAMVVEPTAKPGSPLSCSSPRRRVTQRVTAADTRSGQIRVPTHSQDILPTKPSGVTVKVAGATLDASWNPRTTGDSERSGIIRLGKRTMETHFTPGGSRDIVFVDGVYEIS